MARAPLKSRCPVATNGKRVKSKYLNVVVIDAREEEKKVNIQFRYVLRR